MGPVLVVAAADVTRAEVVAALRALDYEVRTADDAVEALPMLARAEEGAPTLLLLDASLETGGRHPVLDFLRTRRRTLDVRVVVMAGGDVNERELARYGVAEVLRKPVAIERLVDVVRLLAG